MTVGTLRKHALATLAAALLLAIAVGSASAGRLSISNQNIRVTWRSMEFEGGGITARCPITLEGSFHTRTLNKVAGALAGAVTKAIINQAACVEASGATFNGVERYNGAASPQTLPWHITYESFSGSLPNITALQALVSRFRFGVTIPGVCTAQYGTAEDNITASATREGGGGITGIAPVEGRNTITLFRRDAGFLCPNGRMRGTGSVMLLGNTNRLTITLI